MKERFGLNMVIDTLRGSKSEKIQRFALDKLSTYGVCEQSARQLRAVIEHLILSGYLIKTDEEYPLIKLGKRANEVLRDGAVVQMKLLQEEERVALAPDRQRETRPLDRRLFAVLRELRLAIANEQNLPAFVIFPDSTLTDMCLKIPQTREALLQVTGVGQVKAQRYGRQFLKAISDFLQNNEQGEIPAEAPADFDPAAIEITDEPVTISVVADRINCVLMESGYRKISGQRINDWLVSRDYLLLTAENGKNFKTPAPKGETLGITNEERSIRGENVRINYFGRQAQECIIANALDILGMA
jgi:ATP-dependent DNA helicase RecQ